MPNIKNIITSVVLWKLKSISIMSKGIKGFLIWFSGLSGSGKTTLSNHIADILKKKKYPVKQLDGDVLRKGLNNDLGFSIDDRNENIRRAVEVGNLFLEEKYIVICSFITPTESMRELIRNKVIENRLLEVWLNTPLSICMQRDVKGLYQLAKDGKLQQMTGVSALYEPNQKTDLSIDTSVLSVENSIQQIYFTIKKKFHEITI